MIYYGNLITGNVIEIADNRNTTTIKQCLTFYSAHHEVDTTLSALLARTASHRWIPQLKVPLIRSCVVFFDVNTYKLLDIYSSCRSFGTPSCSDNVTVKYLTAGVLTFYDMHRKYCNQFIAIHPLVVHMDNIVYDIVHTIYGLNNFVKPLGLKEWR